MIVTLPVTTLDGHNSTDFLKHVFHLYENEVAFSICRNGIDFNDYPSLQVTAHLPTEGGFGWFAPQLFASGQSPEIPAQVVFSSGTEGKPKAVVLSRRALTDVENRLIEVMQITTDISEYVGVPVTYSFGLGRARVIARVGGRCYIPQRFDPVEIRDMLQRDEINAISAVPSMWRILLSNPDFLGALGQKIKWIEIGSQYMSAAEKAAMQGMFPNARIVQHYGLTEASRSTFLIINETSGEALESVGKPVGDVAVKIGPSGRICIKGPHLASGILNNAGELVSLVDDEGWHHTNDRGEIRDGFLYYLGRLDDQINLSGIKVAAEMLENEVSALVRVEAGHFALTSIEDALRGEVILLAYDAHAKAFAGLLEAATLQVLAQKGIQATGQIRTLAVEELPRTGSNKIQRKELRTIWHDQHRDAGTASDKILSLGDLQLTEQQERIAAVWRSVLGPVVLRPESGFYDVGGDSLGAMQIGLAMEPHFPREAVRATLEGRSLAEIARVSEPENATQTDASALPIRTVKSWTINMTRGFMVIAVILSHWMPGVWGRIAPNMGIDPLALISRMGTPSFAIVFGLGIACFMIDGYPQNKRSISKRLRFSLFFVGLSMVVLAIIQQILLNARGIPLTAQNWAQAFYSVLGYYFLALASIQVWLFAMHRRVMTIAIIGVPAFWILWILSKAYLGGTQWENGFEWLRLMMVANYSYFYMTALVFCGIALGSWMMQETDIKRFASHAILFGGMLFAAGLISAVEKESVVALVDRSASFWRQITGAMVYVGFTTLFLGLSAIAIKNWKSVPNWLRYSSKLLILLGGLALPAYVLHGMVIPLKDILVISGLSAQISLAFTLACFFGLIGYGMWRLDRMYFR